MRLWPPPFGTGNIFNSFDGVDIPNTVGANLNMANALVDSVGGLLGGGPTVDQGASAGGISGGAGSGARAPGPAPNGGGGAGASGSSGGSDGGAGPVGGGFTPETCEKITDTPPSDPDDVHNRGAGSNSQSAGGNSGGNGALPYPMPAGFHNTCQGGSGNVPNPLGCDDCEARRRKAQGVK